MRALILWKSKISELSENHHHKAWLIQGGIAPPSPFATVNFIIFFSFEAEIRWRLYTLSD